MERRNNFMHSFLSLFNVFQRGEDVKLFATARLDLFKIAEKLLTLPNEILYFQNAIYRYCYVNKINFLKQGYVLDKILVILRRL